MPRGKKFSAEQIIGKLREAEVGRAQGKTVPEVVRKLGVTEQTYYHSEPSIGIGRHCRRLAAHFASVAAGEFGVRADRDRGGMLRRPGDRWRVQPAHNTTLIQG